MKMDDLKLMHCTLPKKGDLSLNAVEISEFLPQIPEWEIVEIEDIERLIRRFKFNNFRDALNFTNQIGELAEREDHHPAILTEWGKVTITWWTHAVGGLHRNDFISAAKTDEIFVS
jgi:4a-hydroxytetrahydrobiopterin dehydratase